jgi:UDP-3-O-[3-hydroxymyristoyl] glucosamine N-acyltransferase
VNAVTLTLADLAERLGAELVGDAGVEIHSAATLDGARPGQLSFLHNPKYRPLLETTLASAVVVGPRDRVPGKNLLVSRNPYLAFARAVTLLHPAEHPRRGVEAGAHVHPTARLGPGVTALGGSAVDEDAEVGDRTVLYPGVYVGRGARVGRDCVLYPNAVVREGCVLGDRVILQPGAVVGSDGFGYARDGARQVKIPQIGVVVLEDDVEVGAGTTIDRAALGETRIGRGTKIDNLVQIAHNVVVGEDCLIVAQTGVAGSARLGNRVILAAQAGVAGHLSIGDGAIVGGQSGVPSDVAAGAVVSGTPAFDHREWLKAQAIVRRLPELRARMRELERRLGEVEAALPACEDVNCSEGEP